MAITVGVFVWIYEKNQPEASVLTGTGIQNNANKIDKIYSVDELVNSSLKSGTIVKVRGMPGNCKFLEWPFPSDYEGPGSGCGLKGSENSISFSNSKDPLLSIEKYQEYKDEIVVGGKVGYCGGKKIKKYICSLYDVTFIENVDATSNWQTYRNDKYGFEFKYPKSWFIHIPKNAEPSNFYAQFGPSGVGDMVFIKQAITLDITDIPQDTNLEDFAENNAQVEAEDDYKEKITIEDTLLDNISAKKIHGENGYERFAFFYQGKAYLLRDNGQNGSSAEFSLILSTFEFIN
ncbi:MAG: PsbP-related protein [Parcubacteria group bacterium]